MIIRLEKSSQSWKIIAKRRSKTISTNTLERRGRQSKSSLAICPELTSQLSSNSFQMPRYQAKQFVAYLLTCLLAYLLTCLLAKYVVLPHFVKLPHLYNSNILSTSSFCSEVFVPNFRAKRNLESTKLS